MCVCVCVCVCVRVLVDVFVHGDKAEKCVERILFESRMCRVCNSV